MWKPKVGKTKYCTCFYILLFFFVVLGVSGTGASISDRMPINGAYLSDCGPIAPIPSALDVDLRNQLWKVTEQQLNEALEKLN
jgi:hypothetical protein